MPLQSMAPVPTKTLVRGVATLFALYAVYAIWSLGQIDVLRGAGIVLAIAALALVWLSDRLTVQLVGLTLAGGILGALFGLASVIIAPMTVGIGLPLAIIEARRPHDA